MRLLLVLLCSLATATSIADEPHMRAGGRSQRHPTVDTSSHSEFPEFEFPAPQLDVRSELTQASSITKRQPIPLAREPQSNGVDKDLRSQPHGVGLTTLLTALSVVVFMLLGMAKLFSKRNPFAAPGIPREAVDVLGRRTVDPRSSIYVVRVGAKVLLLGSSTNGLTTLSEITDPIEVATISSLCRGAESDRTTFVDWYDSLLGRKPRSFSERLGASHSSEVVANELPLSNMAARSVREGQHVG